LGAVLIQHFMAVALVGSRLKPRGQRAARAIDDGEMLVRNVHLVLSKICTRMLPPIMRA